MTSISKLGRPYENGKALDVNQYTQIGNYRSNTSNVCQSSGKEV